MPDPKVVMSSFRDKVASDIASRQQAQRKITEKAETQRLAEANERRARDEHAAAQSQQIAHLEDNNFQLQI